VFSLRSAGDRVKLTSGDRGPRAAVSAFRRSSSEATKNYRPQSSSASRATAGASGF